MGSLLADTIKTIKIQLWTDQKSLKNASRRDIHLFVLKYFKFANYANKVLIEDLMFYCFQGEAAKTKFNECKSLLTRRLKALHLHLAEANTFEEKRDLLNQFLEFSKACKFIGIRSKEIRGSAFPKNETAFNKGDDPSKHIVIVPPTDLDQGVQNALSIKKGSGKSYFDYVKANVERAVIADFKEMKEISKYEVMGLCDTISRTTYINSMSDVPYDRPPAADWAKALYLIHETAHIEWDDTHIPKSLDEKYSEEAQRYAFVVSLQFLFDLLDNAEMIGLADKTQAIIAAISYVKFQINEANPKLGHVTDDFSLKISSK